MGASDNLDFSQFQLPLAALSDALRRRKLILVLGAGVSIRAGLPSWNDLVEPLRSDLGHPGPSPELDPRLMDPLYVTEIYEQTFSKPALRNKVMAQLHRVNKPSALHEMLARLDVPSIFTTNYDRLMEAALENAGRQYVAVSRDPDYAYQGAEGSTTVVVKLHGDLMAPSEMVLTKSDFYDYGRTHSNILRGFQDRLKTHTALFVGVSMRDPNLEGLFEQALRQLSGEGLKHYVLVKDWHPDLMQYYSLHFLQPVPLESWDHIELFLAEIARRAGHSPPERFSLPSGLTEASRAPMMQAFDDLVEEAVTGVQKEYNDLRNRFRKGCRGSIKPLALDLWKRLEKRTEDRFQKLKASVAVLLARLCLQTPHEVEVRSAEGYLKVAEQLADESYRKELTLVRAMWLYASGNTNEALKIVEQLDDDEAIKLKVAFLLDSERLAECSVLIDQAPEAPVRDEEWAWMIARFHVLQEDFRRAYQSIQGWLEHTDADPSILEMAGYILTAKAQKRQREFCDQYNIFPNFSLILMHEELLDCDSAMDGSEHFEKAGDLFKELGEASRAEECYSATYKLKQMCKTFEKELTNLLTKVLESGGPSVNPALQLIARQSASAVLTIESFDAALTETDYLPVVLNRLKEWASTKEAAREAAELLKRGDVVARFDSLESQIMLTAVTAELWERADESVAALRVIDRLAPPVEYAHYPLVLRVAHLIHTNEDPAVARIINELPEHLRGHPLILALLCTWHELKKNRAEMLSAASQLVDIIPINQTFDYYLTALGQLRKFPEMLEGLDRAKAEGVKLGPIWTHINRARALLALNRDEEAQKLIEQARELEKKGDVTLGPQDLLYLLQTHAQSGRRDKAVNRARELVDRYPDFPEGHLVLAQLLMAEDRPDEAFEVAEKAARRFEKNDAVQAEYIRIGVMTGHGKAVEEEMRRFSERFPDSSLLRLVPKEKAFEMVKKFSERADWASLMYRQGRFPAIQTASMESTIPSFFRFREARTRMAAGIYVACGEQGKEWTYLTNESLRIKGAVLDFGALVTTFELTKRFDDWTKLVRKIFPKVFLPTSFRRVLAIEASSLLGGIQAGRYKSMKELRNTIDWDRRFKPIPTPEDSADWLGETTERAFALERGIFYLHEFGDEQDRIPREFGFQELAVHLSSTGLLTPAQQKGLERLAAEREFRPLPRQEQALRDIVADVRTLQALHERELLPTILPYFEAIHISEPGRKWLLSEIASMEFTEDVDRRFREFELWIKRLTGWIEWVETTDEERERLGAQKAIQLTGHLREPLTYLGDLFAVSVKKECFFVTDDRFTRMAHFGSDRKEDQTQDVVRIGSDTLIRYLYKGMAASISLETYIDLYKQLMDWCYRHLPLDADVVMSMWPKDAGDAIMSESPLMYFPRSTTEYLDLASGDEGLGRGILGTVVNDYNEQLALVLRRAYVEGRSPAEAARLLEKLALNFVSDRFKGRAPEYLVSLFTQVLLTGEEVPAGEDTKAGEEFLMWLDNSLRAAGITEDDIDYGWRGHVHRFLTIPVPAESRSLEKEAKSSAIAKILYELPDRTREMILGSPVGQILRESFGWEFDSGRAYFWRVPDETGVQQVSITDRQIDELVLEHRAAIQSGETDGESGGGVRIQVRARDKDSFFPVVDALPDEQHMTFDKWPSVSRIMPVIRYFDGPEGDLRLSAWDAGRAKLERFERNLEAWDNLKEPLRSAQEGTWNRAAQDCIGLLMSSAEVFASIASEAFTYGSQFVMELLSLLKIEHVRLWFHFPLLTWDTGEELTSWAEKTCSTVAQRDVGGWSRIREFAYHSLFPDAPIFRKHLVHSIVNQVAAGTMEASEIKNYMHSLLDEAEENPCPVYRTNTVLTVTELIKEETSRTRGTTSRHLWQALPGSDGGLSVHARTSSLLLKALSDSPSVFSRDAGRESEQSALCTAFSAALSSLWEPTSQESQPEPRRYLACVAGGYLAAALQKDHRKNKDTTHWRELRRDLLRIKISHAWTEPDTAPGVYRPCLATSLHYPAAYAVKALAEFADTVSAYLMSDELHDRLIDIAEMQQVFHSMLWGRKGAQLSWLDAALDTRPDAGIHEFLKTMAGTSIRFWTSDERRRLESLTDQINPDREFERLRRQVIGGSRQSKQPATAGLLRGIWLGCVTKRKGWTRLLEKCLQEEFLSHLEKLGDMYWLWITSLPGLLLTDQVGPRTRRKLRRLLLRPVDEIPSPEVMRVHAESLALLLMGEWYHDSLETWLRQVAEEDSVAFEIRRTVFRVINDILNRLPEKVRVRLIPVLREVSESPQWKGTTEFIAFGGKQNGGWQKKKGQS